MQLPLQRMIFFYILLVPFMNLITLVFLEKIKFLIF